MVLRDQGGMVMEVQEESKLIGSPRSSDRNRRPRLLHSYGASLLTVAHKTYGKAAESNGPIGSLARTLASIASPILQPLQHQWLSILSFIDEQILAVEDVAMSVFPPSARIFKKIDELALLADSLPRKLDDTMDGLVVLVHQLPLLDWAWMNASAVLKPFFAGSCNSSDDMDAIVDIKCDEQPKAVASSEEEENGIEVERTEKGGKFSFDSVQKDVSMEEDIREVEETCNEIMGAREKIGMVEEENGLGSEGEQIAVATRDPILELFDEGWQSKPLRGKKVQ